MTNNQKLKQLMNDFHFNYKLVSMVTGRPWSTVKSWCIREDSDTYRVMPDNELAKVVKSTECISNS